MSRQLLMNSDGVTVTDFTARRTMMVDTQVRPSDVTKFPIIDAMLSVPRELYVPARLQQAAYVGEHIDLGEGRWLLDPRTFAKMVDSLDIEQNHVVMDIGCGLGYSTAVLAHMAEFVAGVEDDPKRAEDAQANLSANGVDNAAVIESSLSEGAESSAPYDIILIEGMIEQLSSAVEKQLREGGRIAAIFRDDTLGTVRIGHKIDGVINWRYAFNASAPQFPGFSKEDCFKL